MIGLLSLNPRYKAVRNSCLYSSISGISSSFASLIANSISYGTRTSWMEKLAASFYCKDPSNIK